MSKGSPISKKRLSNCEKSWRSRNAHAGFCRNGETVQRHAKKPLDIPERKPLTTDEIRTALIDMKARAESMDLEVTDIAPGIRGFVENAQRVVVDMSLIGDLADFKAFFTGGERGAVHRYRSIHSSGQSDRPILVSTDTLVRQAAMTPYRLGLERP
jgi:hypothetical protein